MRPWTANRECAAVLCLVVAWGVGGVGCRTLDYRSVQRDFEAAVRADNALTSSPFTGASEWYAATLERLTPAYIGGLEPALRPNAWMLRAVAAWRTGAAGVALESARRGAAEPTLQAGSRDAILLHLVPALVTDAVLAGRFQKCGGTVSAQEYAAFEREFKAALVRMAEAGTLMTVTTPDSVRHYWHYQSWRLLQNWRSTIAGLQGTPEGRNRARAEAERAMGDELKAAADRHAQAIPQGHELRRLIEAQAGK